MKQFLMGMICGVILLYTAMHYHVVRGQEGVLLVPKISNNFADPYVDIREFKLAQWKQHKQLAAAIVQSNQSHLLGESSLRSFGSRIRGMVDGLFQREST